MTDLCVFFYKKKIYIKMRQPFEITRKITLTVRRYNLAFYDEYHFDFRKSLRHIGHFELFLNYNKYYNIKIKIK